MWIPKLLPSWKKTLRGQRKARELVPTINLFLLAGTVFPSGQTFREKTCIFKKMSSNRTRFRVFSFREGTPCATIVGIFFVQKGGRISSQQTKVLVVAKWLSHCYSPRSLCAYRRSCPRAPPAEGKTPEKKAVKSQVKKWPTLGLENHIYKDSTSWSSNSGCEAVL